MKSLKIITVLSLLLITFFSFVKVEKEPLKLNLDNIDIIEILSKQKYECRPSSNFMFYVETKIIKKLRGANNINAKVYFLDRLTGSKNLLADENLQVAKFKNAFVDNHTETKLQTSILNNGDQIIGGAKKAPYSFNELVKFESIYSSYKKSRSKFTKK
jgi:hypothetical protein